MVSEYSAIAMHGERYQECHVNVVPIPSGAMVWLDDLNRLPIGNLRLSDHDAKALIAKLTQIVAAER